jgi:hypothetical protein
MATVIQILTTNYSGETAHITFTPCSGGTIDLGNRVLPYNYESENYQGSYSLYFSAFTKTCTFEIPCPTSTPTPTPMSTSTPTPTPTVDCQCPSGYTESSDGSICYRVLTSSPTVNDTLQPEAGADNNNYGQFGVKIYNVDDYNISGNTISGNLAFSGFTVVADGSPTTDVELFYSTRMNANNVWVAGDANWPGPNYPDYISFCSTFVLTQSKTYYVGIAGDNDVTIKLNGVTLVNQVDTLPDANFKFWHVYPVTLNAGPNIIELENWNRSQVGSFAAEIYDNTLSEMINATGTTMLNIVFATGDYLPGGSKAGEGFCSNYTCPSGYTLDTTDPLNPICKLIETTSCINGTPTPTPVSPTATPTQLPATATPTPTTTITPTDTPTPEPATPTPTTTITPTDTPTPEPATPTPTPTDVPPTDTPTPTPTITVDPTATPTPTFDGYYYYSIRQYDCSNSCAIISPDLVGRSITPLSTNDGQYYKLISEPNVYQVQTEITPAPMSYDIDFDNNLVFSNADCTIACSTPTATPTPTGAPTNTPTPTPLPATNTPTPQPTNESTHTPTPTETPIPSYPYQGCISSTYNNQYNACQSQIADFTFYTAFPTLNLGDTLYTDSGLTSAYDAGLGNYFIIEDGVDKYVIDTYNGGSINSLVNCLAIPGPTATPTPTPTNTETPLPATDTPTPTPTVTLHPTITAAPATETPTPTPEPTPSYYTFNSSTLLHNNAYDACQGGFGQVVYSNVDLISNIVIGSTIFYQDTNLTTPIVSVSGNTWVIIGDISTSVYAVSVDGSGLVTSTIECASVFAPTPTPTPSATPIPTCYLYEVFADDGTSNKNSYSFTYVNCTGGTVNSSVVNLESRTVCARQGTIISASPYISDGGEGAICGSDPTQVPTNVPTDTPTPTPLPATDTPTPSPLPATLPPTATPTPTPLPATDTPTPSPLPATDTPTPSPLPATDTPTPSPSPLPPTDTPTPSPLPATAVPTETPTPTPTPQPVVTAKYHGTIQPSGYLACSSGTDFSVSLNNVDFCSTTTYTSNFFTSLGTNTFWISYDGNYVQIFHTGSETTASRNNSCQSCNNTPATNTPTPLPTDTPTPLPATATPTPTGAPTNTPTPSPSPLPATAVPTATPTPLPTDTPTPLPATATPEPVINVKFFTSQPSGYLDCNGGTQISVSLNAGTFCETTTFTSSYFTSLGTTTFWLAYDGNYLQIYHGSGNTASRSQSCQACNSTPATATPLPATATPEPATATPTPCPSAGTLLETYCSDFDLYGTYANGSCGSYNQLIESNSGECGYQEPTATPLPATATPLPATATPAPSTYSYQIGVDQPNRTIACNNFNGDPQTEVFSPEGNPAFVLEFFTDVNLTTPFSGSSDVYCYAPSTNLSNKYTTNINSMGMSISSREACA